MDLSHIKDLHVVKYGDIAMDYEAKGVHLYDLHDSHQHFENWHSARALPEHDSEGKHYRSSQIWFRQYQEDPQGEATCPLYVNVWHFFIDLMEKIGVDWEQDARDRRVATVPLYPRLLDLYNHVASDKEVDSSVARWIQINPAMPSDVVEQLRTDLKKSSQQKFEAAQECRNIIEQYGKIDDQYPDLGKGFFIHLEI